MFDIKRARNNFKGFLSTLSADEYDGFMYVLESAVGLYSETASEKLEGCQDLIRVWSELAYFDKEKREVHLQMSFQELEAFTTAMYDVMLAQIQVKPEHSFDKLLEHSEIKIWTTKNFVRG